MKPVRIVRRNFKLVARQDKEWRRITGLADWYSRTIYIDKGLPQITRWSERVILEHERAHFAIMDAEIDDQLFLAQDELLADWVGLVRTPDKYLHKNERFFKRWLLNGQSWKRSKLSILTRFFRMLKTVHPRNKARRLLKTL